MWYMKQTFIITSLICLLASCSEPDGGIEAPVGEDLNKEVVIQSVGSFSDSAISAESYPGSLYPMQVFDKSQIMDNGAFNELQVEISPYSLIFNFHPVPYIEEISEPKGYLSFSKAFASAMTSEEWSISQGSDIKSKSLLLAYGTYSSKEKARAFLGEPSLYRLVDECSGKYMLLAKLVIAKFDVLAYFEGKFTGGNVDNLCYVSSVTFGRSVYLALSSDESHDKLRDIFCEGILKGDMAHVDDYLGLSSRSVIANGCGGGGGGYWGESGYKTLINIFNPGAIYAGVPIAFELRDAATNEAIRF